MSRRAKSKVPDPHRAPTDVDLILEKSRNTTRPMRTLTPRRAAEVRDELLKAIAPVKNHSYDPKALALVEEFEAALRRAWERIEQAEARARAEAAIADALNMPRQWRLM